MSDRPLKMVTCPGCDAKTFIPGDLPPLAIEPCKKCGHAIMMPMQLRQFELRSKIASGGMGTVYRAWDTTLERAVAVKLTGMFGCSLYWPPVTTRSPDLIPVVATVRSAIHEGTRQIFAGQNGLFPLNRF